MDVGLPSFIVPYLVVLSDVGIELEVQCTLLQAATAPPLAFLAESWGQLVTAGSLPATVYCRKTGNVDHCVLGTPCMGWGGEVYLRRH